MCSQCNQKQQCKKSSHRENDYGLDTTNINRTKSNRFQKEKQLEQCRFFVLLSLSHSLTSAIENRSVILVSQVIIMIESLRQARISLSFVHILL